ncbi:drug/metabolite transporter (DMT)-like permease [Microbacterium keratanolyticum]|uniref:Uncharacterized protein n=1 Tax=Microbacterium keratanolyticum TaxID=67574 RepID=A0A9W6HRH6_9MICO|nr:hypothetical protein [Microbacterium keratanolyticum]MBM7469094.1 drug/metabolite transporter (DMT)-like permease [Microbacterium keratanolyticum]GLK01173.1 hypothetical protein GCM10017596_08880 [Microbacterium keratanolyticum]
MPSARDKKPARDDSAARRAMSLSTWFAVGTGVLGVVLITWPDLLTVGAPWVQLALGVITLVLAFRARSIGSRSVNDYDGRLSLLAAILGFITLFFAGAAAFNVLLSLGS